MSRAMHLQHARVAGRDDLLLEWVDRDPIARETLRERWIGDLIERDEHPRDRREDARHRETVASRHGRATEVRKCEISEAPNNAARWRRPLGCVDQGLDVRFAIQPAL